MEKTIDIERLYSLGDFRNIKFKQTITEIPDKFLKDPKLSGLLWYLGLVEIETAFHRYQELATRFHSLDLENILELLETERTRTFEELFSEVEKEMTE